MDQHQDTKSHFGDLSMDIVQKQASAVQTQATSTPPAPPTSDSDVEMEDAASDKSFETETEPSIASSVASHSDSQDADMVNASDVDFDEDDADMEDASSVDSSDEVANDGHDLERYLANNSSSEEGDSGDEATWVRREARAKARSMQKGRNFKDFWKHVIEKIEKKAEHQQADDAEFGDVDSGDSNSSTDGQAARKSNKLLGKRVVKVPAPKSDSKSEDYACDTIHDPCIDLEDRIEDDDYDNSYHEGFESRRHMEEHSDDEDMNDF